jgi:FkbM family methyltransferase
MRFDYGPPWADPGDRLTLDIEGYRPDDAIAKEIDAHRTFYEVDLLEHIGMAGPRGGLYIDVGANIGNHSVYFGKFLADHVLAIEPHPSLLPLLKRNLEVNGIRNASILPCAIGAEPGVGRMLLKRQHAVKMNIGGSQVVTVETERDALDDPDTVPITTLDQAYEAWQGAAREWRVTLVKMDIEGMELPALTGGRSLLTRHRPQLVLELATAEARAAVTTFLAQFGYRHTGRRFGWSPTYHFIDPTVHALRPDPGRPTRDREAEFLDRASFELSDLVAEGETFVLVDDEQCWPGLVVDGRHRLPFLERDGQYWGRAADTATAIREVHRMRAAGAAYLAFAWPAFWWLDHYHGLAEHLRSRFPCRLENERLVVFDLRAA